MQYTVNGVHFQDERRSAAASVAMNEMYTKNIGLISILTEFFYMGLVNSELSLNGVMI